MRETGFRAALQGFEGVLAGASNHTNSGIALELDWHETLSMQLNEFEVRIPEGVEADNGYVEVPHGTQYTIVLQNHSKGRCDAEVYIDGKSVGAWRVDGCKTVTLERPVHDSGRFTFYRLGTASADKAGLERNDSLGVISATFKPEKIVAPPTSVEVRREVKEDFPNGFGLNASEPSSSGFLFASEPMGETYGLAASEPDTRAYPPASRPEPDSKTDKLSRAGGTGLSGKSQQVYGEPVANLEYERSKFVTINLRLIAPDEEPRPLFPRSTSIPPPVH